jgi:hypothetical protein
MIRNLTTINKLITIDLSLKEIRITEQNKPIEFIKLRNQESECLNYCNDDNFFKRLVRDILKENSIKINLKEMKFLR